MKKVLLDLATHACANESGERVYRRVAKHVHKRGLNNWKKLIANMYLVRYPRNCWCPKGVNSQRRFAVVHLIPGAVFFYGQLCGQGVSEGDLLGNGKDGRVTHCAPAAWIIRNQELGTVCRPRIYLARRQNPGGHWHCMFFKTWCKTLAI